ncbi:MAG: class I SAM-dependent methyltransferase [Myxococcales bacterium]|nr:class I SAM-dependent methyltransferase [Myxococcales bacterium]
MTDLFADKASDWDTMPIPQAISQGVSQALLRNVALDETLEVMDFGAGTGLLAAALAPRVARIWAVDVSATMLDALAAKPELRGQVEPVCQDILAEPLKQQFDLIVSAMAMHHVADTEALLAQFAGHLKGGGRIALADLDQEDGSFHPPTIEGVFHPGFDRERLRGLLLAAGFVDIAFTTALEVSKEGTTYPIFLVTAELS